MSAMCVYKGTFSVYWVLIGMWQNVNGCQGASEARENLKERWVCGRNVGFDGN